MGRVKGRKKILVVDDESSISGLIAQFCETMGFEARIHDERREVMDEVKEFHPDLITLDLIMPEHSGIEILEDLKQDPEAKKIPVIIVSSIAGSGAAEDILKDCRAVLSKPIRMQTLQEQIEAVFAA